MASAAQQLLPAQQEALEQFMAVTNEDEASSRAILQRSAWSVPVAIAKFFDGEADQVIAPPHPEQPSLLVPPQGPMDHDPFNPDLPFHPEPMHPQSVFDAMIAVNAGNQYARRQAAVAAAPPVERTEVARRIVPAPAAPVYRPPFLLGLLLAPFSFGYRALGSVWRMVVYMVSLLPGLVGLRATAGGWTLGSRLGRRQLSPRDAAARFRREMEEMCESKALPFLETSYAQAYDKAKTEPKLLLVVLLSPEHDDTKKFVRNTLLSPEVVEVLTNPANNYLLWGGNVRDVEAFQVSNEFKCTKLPFAAIVSVTPKEGSGSTRMGIIKRMMGPIPPQVFAAQLLSVTRKYADDLAAVRAVRVTNETSRSIRAEQDDAYERSLARDRERARQRREAEERAREAAEAAVRHAQLRKQWRHWRAATLAPEPAPGTPDIVRVAIKLPEAQGGARVRRSFAGDATVEDLYAFVECYGLEAEVEDGEAAEGSSGSTVSEKQATKPEDYTHDYRFRIASMLPREVHEPDETKTLLEVIGKSASLVVEEVDEDDEDDEAEGTTAV